MEYKDDQFIQACKAFVEAERKLSEAKAMIQQMLGIQNNYFGVVKVDWTTVRRIGDSRINRRHRIYDDVQEALRVIGD